MKHITLRSMFAVSAVAGVVGVTYSYVPIAQAEQVVESHQTKGVVESLDRDNNRVKISHGKVPSLNWPPMTMYFRVQSAEVFDRLKKGQEILFAFEEKRKGQYVITEVDAQ